MAAKFEKAPEKCDACGRTVTMWTIVKGFDLLCDPCVFARLAAEHRRVRAERG